MADDPKKPQVTLPSASNYQLDAAGNPIVPPVAGQSGNKSRSFIQRWKAPAPSELSQSLGESLQPLQRAAAEGVFPFHQLQQLLHHQVLARRIQ